MRRIIFTLTLILFLLPGLCLADDLTRETQTLLLKARAGVLHAEKELSKKRSIAIDFKALKSLAEELRVNHLLLQDRFETRKQTVNILGPKAINRHAAMLREYNRVIEQLLTSLDAAATEKSLTSDTIKKLKTFLENIAPKRPNPIYGSLPYRHLNYVLKAPLSGTTIVPAYLGGDKTVKDEDLADTALAPISKTIAEKAQELQWNPVLIYEWVKNNVESEWYWGIQKGAEETLRQKSGNDADQACLLVALLRASGYPSRYVRGTMETFPNWQRFKVLTGIQSEQDLLAFFRKAGIPAKSVIAGGKISNIQIEHIWVESQIPYANYRGAVIDTHGKTWLGLDTHIKTKDYEVKPAKPWPENLDIKNIRNQYLAQNQTQDPIAYLKDYINTWLGLNQPGTTYQDLLETRTLIPHVLKILPAGMQITPIAITHEYADLPDELLHKVRFKAMSPDQTTFFDKTLPAWQLSNNKVVVTYEPESIEDQEIINSYGGLDNTPAYLVRLRPVIKINGERTIIGEAGLGMGSEYVLEMELISPNGSEKISNTHIMGNLILMGIVSQQALIPKDMPLIEKSAEQLLYEEALNYIRRWNQAEEELSSLLKIALVRPIPTLVTLGGVIQVDYLLDQPHDFTFKGIYVDADLRSVELIPRPSSSVPNPQPLFMQLSSLQGSVLENKVIEDDFGIECISTAKLFQVINSQPANPQPVNIDKTNITAILPTLSLPQNIKDAISNAVNQGFIVKTPQTEFTYEDWTGTGYLMERAQTGEAGYMLSGQIAGSMTAWGLMKWPEYVGNTLRYPFAEPPSLDPQSGRNIIKMTITDLQRGIVGQALANPLTVLVYDKDSKPVPNVEVTFTVKAGGGKFGNGATSIKVKTSAAGFATAQYILGQKTADNPVQIQAGNTTNKPFAQQVGENLIDVALENGTKITRPFTAFGFPDESKATLKTHNTFTYPVLSFAGFVSARVEDQHGNLISNRDITYTALDVPKTCVPNNETRLSVLLVKVGDACMQGIPGYDQCSKNGKKSMTVKSSSEGAPVQIFMGAVPDAAYTIKVQSPGLNQGTFTLMTSALGNCSGEAEPSHRFNLVHVYEADAYGIIKKATKPGKTMSLKARIYDLREGDEIKSVTFNCPAPKPPKICDTVVGNRTYAEFTGFAPASLTFGGIPGKALGNGVYQADYVVQPGVNDVRINGSATSIIRKSFNSCDSCRIDNAYALVQNSSSSVRVYGVEIKTEPKLMIPVNKDGFLEEDYKLSYDIQPPEYDDRRCFVYLYKDGQLTHSIADLTRTGFVTLARGFQVNLESAYEAEVVLNPGTGSEIKSDRIKLKFYHFGINSEFKITDQETRMTEEVENREKVLRVLGGMRIHLTGLIKPEDPDNKIKEYEWSATGGTFYDSYDLNAVALTESQLKHRIKPDIYWEGANVTNQDVQISLNATFMDGTVKPDARRIKSRLLQYLSEGVYPYQGDDVKMLQAFLRMIGISQGDTPGVSGTPVAIDGDYSPATMKAVARLQKRDELSTFLTVDNYTLAKIRLHWKDYSAAVEAFPSSSSDPRNKKVDVNHWQFPNWITVGAAELKKTFTDQIQQSVDPSVDPNVARKNILTAWINKEAGAFGHWGYNNIAYRIMLGSADEMGSIGFSQICNYHKYGKSPHTAIQNINLYHPEQAVKGFAVFSNNFIPGGGGFLNAFPIGSGTTSIYKISNNYLPNQYPMLDVSYYEDNNKDLLSKAIMAYNAGPSAYPLKRMTWPETLKTYDPPNLGTKPGIQTAIAYTIDIQRKAGLALKSWTWRCQRINTGQNGKCETYARPNDFQLLSFKTQGKPYQICILPSREDGLIHSILNRDENGNAVPNGDDKIEEYEFIYSEQDFLDGLRSWTQRMFEKAFEK